MKSNNLEEKLKEIKIDLIRFILKYDVKLLYTDYTNENGHLECMYFFNDFLGGYTIEAIRESLK